METRAKSRYIFVKMMFMCNRSIPVDIKLLPQYLKDAGYLTYMIGKWHSGMCSWSMAPTRRGFDGFSGCLHGNGDHYFLFKGNPYDFW